MEEKYFIIINGVQKGPYSIQELNTQNITLDTLVWKKGMDCWLKIADMPELASALKDILPPPMPGTTTNVNIQTNKPIQIELSKRKSENNFIADTSKNFWKWLKKLIARECVFLFKEFCCIVVLGIVLFAFIYVYTYPPYLSDKEQEEIRLELSKREPICEELLEKHKESLDDYNWALRRRSSNDWDYVNTKKEEFEYDNEIIEKALQYKGYGVELRTTSKTEGEDFWGRNGYTQYYRNIIHNDLIQKYDIPSEIEKWANAVDDIYDLFGHPDYDDKIYFTRTLSNHNDYLKSYHKGLFNSSASEGLLEFLCGLYVVIYIYRTIILTIWSFVKWVRKNK